MAERVASRPHECIICGEPTQGHRLTCSDLCRQLARGAKTGEYRSDRRTCVVCGAEFWVTLGQRRRPRTTCSANCARQVQRIRASAREERRAERREQAVRGVIPPKRLCARPGCQNPLTGQAMIYCSPRCHYADRARARKARGTVHYHRCHECGTVFVWRPGRGKGIYCSAACKARGGSKSHEPEIVDIVSPVQRHRREEFTDDYPCCRACESYRHLETHHVVFREHIIRAAGDYWHPDVALRLCRSCHAAGHANQTVPLSVLRDENITFAFALLGPAAYDYLRRRYAGEDPRLEQRVIRP